MTAGPLLVGLDIGTSSIKAVIYEVDGTAVAWASVPTITHVPRPTWAFYRAQELWSQSCQVLREAISRVDDPNRIASIAVASMGEAGVLLDAQGRELCDVIAWYDGRTIPQRDRLESLVDIDELFTKTGLSLQAIFSLCKLMWLKDNDEVAWSKAHRWLLMADYIAYKLSGEQATDASLASRTLAFNLANFDWDDLILAAADVPRSLLAPVLPSGTRIGTVTSQASKETNLPEHVVVSTGGQDHVCGAMAAGVVNQGQMLDSIGTAEALFLALDRPCSEPAYGRMGYTAGAHVAPGKFYVYGGLYTSGASIDWFRAAQGNIDHQTLFAEAAEAPLGSLGVIFIPHLRFSNAPHYDPRARGAFIGLTMDVTCGVLARSVLEGLAYEARTGLEPLAGYAGLDHLPELTVIGGGSRNDLLLSIKASVLNTTLRVSSLNEATALGAAMLGGMGAGIYQDVTDALNSLAPHTRPVEANLAQAAAYDAFYREVYQPLFSALQPLNHRIHALLGIERDDQ